MLMGFIGFGSTPPAPAAPDGEPPRDQGPDDTGIRIPSTSGRIRSLYGRKSSKASRYAWAISLGIHALVLLGAFLAMRYYFRPVPATRVSPDDSGQNGFGPIVQSADAAALIQTAARPTSVSGDSAADSELFKHGNLPALVRHQPQTTLTLHDLSPMSGVEGLTGARGAVGLPRRLATRTIAP